MLAALLQQASCLTAARRAGSSTAATSAVPQLARQLLAQRAMSSAGGPVTATPPANTARGATADLADVFIPESVDEVAVRKVNIMEPIFQCVARAEVVAARRVQECGARAQP